MSPLAKLYGQWRSGTTGVVAKAMGLFGGVQMLVILCGVIRVKIVAIILGATGVGLFSIFNNALTLLSTATQLGLRTSAVREVATDAGNDSGAYMVRQWGGLLAAFGAIVTLVLSPLLSLYTFGDFSHTLPFMLLAPCVWLMAQTTSEQAVMQGRNRLGSLARSTIAGVAGGLIISLPLIYFLGLKCILPVIIAYALTAWVGTRLYRVKDIAKTDGQTLKMLWEQGKPMLRLGGYMTLAAAFTEIVNYVFTVYLTHSGGTETVGIYQSGYTIVMRYVGMVFTALGVEYYPRLASACGHRERQQVFIRHETMMLMVILCPLLAIFLPLAPFAVRLLYSREFLDTVPYILAATPGIVLRGYSWCLSFLMLARGDGRTFVVTEIISDLIGLTLNIVLYRYGGMTGLGVSFTLWYLIYALMMTLVNFKLYKGRISPKIILTTLSVFLFISLISASLFTFL